jgi:hypothetical protein
MKVGIMQPYFFPYFGYFQLINAVDIYVNLDHVSFMKRSYMTRNTINNNFNINVSVYGGSQNKKTNEVLVNFENDYINKFKKSLHHQFSKTKNYEKILDIIINPNFESKNITITEFNFQIIEGICNYLDIKTKFLKTSEGITSKKKSDGLIEICEKVGGNLYINAIGGQKLYDKEYFLNKNIELYFLKMGEINFKNKYTSILELLMNYEKENLINQLNNYELI